MMRPPLLLISVMLMVGCGEEISPEEQARRDTRDIAMVEAAQHRHAPIQPVFPEPITAADAAPLQADGTACAFYRAGGAGSGPIALTGSVTGHIKLKGTLVTFASDSGSPVLPGGTYRKYVSRTHWLEIGTGGNDGAASLSIHDRFDRIIYAASGELKCSS